MPSVINPARKPPKAPTLEVEEDFLDHILTGFEVANSLVGMASNVDKLGGFGSSADLYKGPPGVPDQGSIPDLGNFGKIERFPQPPQFGQARQSPLLNSIQGRF